MLSLYLLIVLATVANSEILTFTNSTAPSSSVKMQILHALSIATHHMFAAITNSIVIQHHYYHALSISMQIMQLNLPLSTHIYHPPSPSRVATNIVAKPLQFMHMNGLERNYLLM
eukprot:945973_1